MSEPADHADPAPLPVVSRFEANLLRVLRFFFRQHPPELAVRLIADRVERPKCLGPAAVALAKDTLAKGTILFLVREGAWKRDRFIQPNGRPTFGRLWERSKVERLALTFSGAALDFACWLTAAKPKDDKPFWAPPADAALTPADQLLLFLAYDACRAADRSLADLMRGSDAFQKNPLCWLVHAGDFAGDGAPPDFRPWLDEPQAFVLEALQPFLEARWLAVERAKGQLGDWGQMNREGQAQYQVLSRFLDAADGAGRRDLARFVLAVMGRLFAADQTPSFWFGGLQGSGPNRLAERLDTHRNALALPRQFERLRAWEQASRRSGFMDEDYEASKFWLAECERYDCSAAAARAEHVVRQVEPLRADA